MQERDAIVEVRSAYKRYTSKQGVLRGLNMTVERGTIYGLLGPSGCGKTTLLVCMTGYKRLDSGRIQVHLSDRSELGYMPQDVALVELFSVSEMLQYFGKVIGLKGKKTRERGRELLNLLHLDPDTFWKRSINSLSGGQQRRVSLAVALLHDPVLLILDEPTVGLDPVLIEEIWDYFHNITKDQDKTIIITTHYIDETRRADTIGLMRNGVLLAETSPQELLAQHSCTSLEEAFLTLSLKQNTEEYQEILPKKRKSIKPAIKLGVLYDGHRIGAQIYKNLCWSKRNVPMTVFILLLPALMMFLFCTVYQDNLYGLVIAVVLEEVLPDSCDSVGTLPHCTPQSRFSCKYVELVRDKYYDVKEYRTYDEAYKDLKDGYARALLRFNRDYTESMIQLFTRGMSSPQEFIEKCTIDANIDMSEMLIGTKIKRDIGDSFKDLARFIFSECGWSVRASEPGIRIEDPIFGERSPKFIHTALAGFIIPFTFFITSFFAASSIISEKINGFLERCLISGVRQTEVMLAYTVMQAIMLVGQNITMFTIAYGVYQLPMKGSFMLAFLFVLIAQIQGMFYGFFLGTLCDLDRNVTYASIGTVIILFLTCGMFWPIEGAHWIFRHVLRYSPIVMAVESYRSITIRGWGLENFFIVKSLLADLLLLIIITLLYVLASRVKK